MRLRAFWGCRSGVCAGLGFWDFLLARVGIGLGCHGLWVLLGGFRVGVLWS